jgi:hypothetical protein
VLHIVIIIYLINVELVKTSVSNNIIPSGSGSRGAVEEGA